MFRHCAQVKYRYFELFVSARGVGGTIVGRYRIHDVLILLPEKGPSFLEFWEIRLDDDNARNNSPRDKGVARPVVAICDELRLRTHSRNIRDVRDRVAAENIIDGAEHVFGADNVWNARCR